MKNLEEIRGNCRMVDGHWLWGGSLRPDGRANIWAPDHTRGGVMGTQAGPRAVWHALTGEAIPAGWRAYSTCDEQTCCNPAHIACAPAAKVYARVARSGVLKGRANRILANRAINRKRATVDSADIAEIQASSETGVAIAARMGLSRQVVSKARRGEYRCLGAMANPFAGLAR